MKKEIIINSISKETRIAILEDDKLMELFVERPENERMVGNIYKGKVENVLRGIDCAFIDIGQPQNGFLHFDDISFSPLLSDLEVDLEKSKKDDRKSVPDLKSGQELLVQVTKEPIYKKGARVSTDISIPGNFLVLLPNNKHIGISRKIGKVSEKKRLKRIAKELCPKDFGLIVRTNAEKQSVKVLKKDLDKLLKFWRGIEKKIEKKAAPSLVHKEAGMATSVIRDLFSNDVDKLVVDSKKLFIKIKNYVSATSPHLADRIEHFSSKKPIFDYYNIETEIDKILNKKVMLKKGSYILIEHTEALVTIDVNSGSFIGYKNHENNALRVNLKAAKEIARQLRLRDIGGLIVIDFIDMLEKDNRTKVYAELKKELKKDRAKTAVLNMSEFGIIEMTRERIRPGLLFTYSESCPTCKGTGRILSKESMALKIERWLKRFRAGSKERRIIFIVNPELGDFLKNKSDNRIFKWSIRYLVKIELRPDIDLNLEEFRVISKKRDMDITEKYMYI